MGQYKNLWNTYHEKESKTRIQLRTKRIKQDLIKAALHPDRIETWLEQGGHALLESILVIA
jgi:hypothetical protein